jgi:hypothetical protein
VLHHAIEGATERVARAEAEQSVPVRPSLVTEMAAILFEDLQPKRVERRLGLELLIALSTPFEESR